MKKMYPAVVNSPKTELPESITSTQTDITVSNASVLLAGEGIATIGNGDTAETITYTSVDGNVLKGCIRGYQGVARSWTAGTRVARNFAAADWDAARDNITELAERLDTPERAAITLQPGVRVVQASQDAAFKLAGLQGRTVLNYQTQIGIYGVLNPYVIQYGANLLPPFYEWETGVATGDSLSLDSPYKVTIKANTTGGSFVRCWVPVIPLQKYTVSVAAQGSNAKPYAYLCRADRTRIDSVKLPFGTITPSSATVYLEIVLNTLDNGSNPATGTAVFTDAMMTIGDTVSPFTPRQDSILALQTELHANPDTGANPDSVFERDGQYFKLAKWRKTTLDGSIAFAPFGSATGLKVVNAMLPGAPAVDGSGTLTKYQGKVIKETDYATVNSAPDNLNIGSSGANGVFDNFQISISNVDSGWGNSYTNLTPDEIKAYFLGWRMYTGEAGGAPYNGSGTKYWHKLSDGITTPGTGTTTLPTTAAPNWTPYQLLYQLATPVVEPITSEGQLTFIDGDNQVEVGTGLVVREATKPPLSSLYNTYEINSVNTVGTVASNPLKYKARKVLTIYKNNRQDKWLRISDTNSYGLERAFLDAALFDPSAAYSVTYLMLDKYPAVDIIGTYAENEKALLLDTIKTLQDNTTRISVLESKKAEKDSPAWITPTLLNGWVNFGTVTTSVGFYKDSEGYVHLKGLIKSGVVEANIFILPEGYRPKERFNFGVLVNNSTANIIGQLKVDSTGTVTVVGGNALVSLDGVSFKVD